MTKKALKHVAKKKVVKKNLRHKLLKKSTKTNERNPGQIIAQSQIQHQDPANSIPTLPGSSIRSQLMQRVGMTPMYGFGAQQYGNINNERKIDQLKSGNQMATQQINNDKATIDTMNQEKARLEAEVKELKKKKKDAKQKYEKTVSAREIAQDEVTEAERIETKSLRENLRRKQLEVRMGETTRKNDIVRNKIEADKLDAEIHTAELNHQTLQGQYDQNHAYHELKKKKDELRKIINENTALTDEMKTDDFLKANEKLIETTKEIEKERLTNELLLKRKEKEKELMMTKMEVQSIPNPKDVEAITIEHAKEIQRIETEEMTFNDQIRRLQIPIESYNYHLELESKARQKLMDAANERYRLSSKYAMIKNDPNNKYQTNLKREMTTLGQQQALNERIELSAKNAHQMLELQMNEAKSKAYVDELSKEPTDEEKDPYVKTGKLEIKNNAMKELKGALTDHRKALFQNAKAESEIAYQNSKDIHQLDDQIIQTQAHTISFQKQTEQRDIYNESLKQMHKAQLALEVNARSNGGGLSNVEQVDFMINEQLKHRMDDFQAKDQVFREVRELSKTFPEQWTRFLQTYPQIGNSFQNLGYYNINIKDLRDIIALFRSFMSKQQQQPALTMNSNFDDDIPV